MRKHQSENVVLKVAWYSSELLVIPASVFRSSENMIIESPAPATTGMWNVPRMALLKQLPRPTKPIWFMCDD
ncbi:unnamed protein product [Rhodiola kirilowii]